MSSRTFMLAVIATTIGVVACGPDVTSLTEANKVAPRFAVSPAGTISDLSVSAVASTSVTLSFTQVDDGTGQPASYDVRYAVSPISWGSAPSVTSGTCTTPVAGTAIGSNMTCTVLGLSPSTKYDFQLVPFRGTLNVNAVLGSLSNVASAVTTGALPPPPPPPPPPGSTNEPVGMTFIDERPFNSLAEHAAPYFPAWDTDSWLTIEQDATAPKSPSSVLRVCCVFAISV